MDVRLRDWRERANVDAAYAPINHCAQPDTQGWQAGNFLSCVESEPSTRSTRPSSRRPAWKIP
jgi:hypothetical protein